VPGRVAFEYPNFRNYMAARFLITCATEMQAVAVGWQVYTLTHRPLDLGLVGLAQFLPGVFLFLAAGHTADRLPRQRILQACYAGFALCSLALLALTRHGLTAAWPVYAVLVGNGTVRAFNGPAGQAFLPALVPIVHFPNAVAWSSSVFMAATITGPAVGGLLYGFAGTAAVVVRLRGNGVPHGAAAGVAAARSGGAAGVSRGFGGSPAGRAALYLAQ
jgi:MFS family permease